MGLMAWSAPTAKIELPGGGDFTVRGLCLRDVTSLWGIFGEELFNIFSGLTELADDDDEDGKAILIEASLMAWMGKVVIDFPDIVCTVIAVASDEEGELEAVATQVAATPIATQIEALLHIYRLTIEEAGGSKKFVDHLATLVTVITGMMKPKQGNIGTGESESQSVS